MTAFMKRLPLVLMHSLPNRTRETIQWTPEGQPEAALSRALGAAGFSWADGMLGIPNDAMDHRRRN